MNWADFTRWHVEDEVWLGCSFRSELFSLDCFRRKKHRHVFREKTCKLCVIGNLEKTPIARLPFGKELVGVYWAGSRVCRSSF